ncbi:MAG: hypothetical protein J6W76_05550, partial [Spirochaetales bacterium]|nr:hypothetical protein [Spirochaetales bacterium]
MSNVVVDRHKIDILANAISGKSGEPVTMTLDEMVEAVDGIEVGGGEPNLQSKTYTVDSAGSETVTADSGYDGLSSVRVSVPSIDPAIESYGTFITESNVRKWSLNVYAETDGESGWFDGTVPHTRTKKYNAVPKNTSVTPTELAQTVGGSDRMMEGSVTVNAIPSDYVGSAIYRRSSSSLERSGNTVTVPNGYYESAASMTVPTSSVSQSTWNPAYSTSNNQRRWRDSVALTRTEGWVSGDATSYHYSSYYNAIPSGTVITPTTSQQTIGGADTMMEGAVTVEAMPSGTAGTPTATKGTVSNHSVSVTPSVTNTTGYIAGSTKTGTAVTVSASELVSGSQTITQNGTVDVTNLAEVVVSVEGGGGGGMTVATATATPSSTSASISFTGLSGDPTSFAVISAADLATGASPYKTAAVVFDGSDLHGQTITNTNNVQVS